MQGSLIAKAWTIKRLVQLVARKGLAEYFHEQQEHGCAASR
jgi:hypothetical protein